uniref:Ig-like domain-containing protein n=1 Tax=Tetranychus urticae TaxID=32264 RepID=T1KKU3_TETUR
MFSYDLGEEEKNFHGMRKKINKSFGMHSLSGRHYIFSSGELYIQRVDPSLDNNYQYRCQTKHRISGEIKLSSNSGRLIITGIKMKVNCEFTTKRDEMERDEIEFDKKMFKNELYSNLENCKTRLFMSILLSSGQNLSKPHSNVAPKVTDRRIRLIAQSGETVILPCSGQGSPVPSITWYKRTSDPYQQPLLVNNLKPTSSSDNRLSELNGLLIFKPVRLHDSGKYICTVKNSIGRDQIETELEVTEPLKVVLLPKLIVAMEGQEMVSFNCSISGSPIRKIFWRKDGSPLPLHNRYRQNEHGLTIFHLKREDRGMYQCSVTNDAGQSSDWSSLTLADDPPKLIELFSESILLEPGSRLSLKCSASGSPLPQITWTLDGFPIGEQLRIRVGDYVTSEGQVNSFVNITSITVDEGGLYTCLATNGVGSSASHSGRVNVLGRPTVKPMGNVTVVAGSTFSINCPYSGHPIESIVWYRRDSRLPENHRHLVLPNGTLVIRGIERSHDQGLYRCLVTNKQGESGASSVFIQVIVAPLISIDSVPNVREGMRNMLTCNVLDGDPPFTFTWTKDGLPIDPAQHENIKIASINEYSSTLFISKVMFKDNGNYTCIISNQAASANQTINVLVKGKFNFNIKLLIQLTALQIVESVIQKNMSVVNQVYQLTYESRDQESRVQVVRYNGQTFLPQHRLLPVYNSLFHVNNDFFLSNLKPLSFSFSPQRIDYNSIVFNHSSCSFQVKYFVMYEYLEEIDDLQICLSTIISFPNKLHIGSFQKDSRIEFISLYVQGRNNFDLSALPRQKLSRHCAKVATLKTSVNFLHKSKLLDLGSLSQNFSWIDVDPIPRDRSGCFNHIESGDPEHVDDGDDVVASISSIFVGFIPATFLINLLAETQLNMAMKAMKNKK